MALAGAAAPNDFEHSRQANLGGDQLCSQERHKSDRVGIITVHAKRVDADLDVRTINCDYPAVLDHSECLIDCAFGIVVKTVRQSARRQRAVRIVSTVDKSLVRDLKTGFTGGFSHLGPKLAYDDEVRPKRC